MPARCDVCGNELSLFERVGENICKKCDEEREQHSARERLAFGELVKIAQSLNCNSDQLAREAVGLMKGSTLPSEERDRWRAEIFHSRAESVLNDDVLLEQEENSLIDFGNALGLDVTDSAQRFETLFPSLLVRIEVGRANAGRIPLSETSPYLDRLDPGEFVYYTVTGAQLLKMGTRYQRTYQGISLPIGKTRMRYHVGSSQGRVITTGFEVADTGTFLITSKRAIFLGQFNTKVVPYSKLLDLKIFSDGVEFYREDRVKPIPVFVGTGVADVVAATANVAIQRFFGTWVPPVHAKPDEESQSVSIKTAETPLHGQNGARNAAFLSALDHFLQSLSDGIRVYRDRLNEPLEELTDPEMTPRIEAVNLVGSFMVSDERSTRKEAQALKDVMARIEPGMAQADAMTILNAPSFQKLVKKEWKNEPSPLLTLLVSADRITGERTAEQYAQVAIRLAEAVCRVDSNFNVRERDDLDAFKRMLRRAVETTSE